MEQQRPKDCCAKRAAQRENMIDDVATPMSRGPFRYNANQPGG